MLTDEVKKMLKDKTQKFDLLILEAFFTSLLGLSQVVKAPVILVSSSGSMEETLKIVGAVSHPLLYPTVTAQKVNDRTFMDKLSELYLHYDSLAMFDRLNRYNDDLKRIFGPETPSLVDLKKDVDMLFLNIHPIWENNRPVPPNVIYMGGLHQNPEKELPQDLKNYLDSSKNGVRYISFGTNVDPSLLPPEKIQTMINVVSKLPYDV